MADFGVYIHYPWCRKRCPYCDFAIAVAPEAEIPHRAYLDAVLAELAQLAPDFADRRLVSIYVGGGTPSLWPAPYLTEAIAAVRARFGDSAPGVRPDPDQLEITLEVNAIDCQPEILHAWREAGVNRVSIGVQSIDAGELVFLGRDHRFGDGPRAVAAALAAGVPRVSADVIIGSLGGSPGGAGPASVSAMADLDPGHLSIYELTVEPATTLGRAVARGEVTPLGEDALAEQYLAAHELLTARGYEHYEVSSFARPGHQGIHNSLYWHGGEYVGVGNSAASLRVRPDGRALRTKNVRSVRAYLAGQRVAEEIELSAAEAAADRLWLGLRTARGVPEVDAARLPGLIEWLLSGELARIADGRVCPTLRGLMCADLVARQVMARIPR